MGKHDNVKYRLILDTKNTSQKVKCNPLDKSYKTIINHFTTLPLWIKRRRFLSPDINIVQFEYKCDMPISYFGLSIRFNMLKIRGIDATNTWKKCTIDISSHKELLSQCILRDDLMTLRLHIAPFPTSPAIRIRFRKFTLRSYWSENKANKVQARKDYQSQIDKFDLYKYLYESEYSCKIDEVFVSDEKIRITGKICQVEDVLYIGEIPIYKEISPESIRIHSVITPQNNHFCISVERYVITDGIIYDRLYSRWVVTIKTSNGLAMCSYSQFCSSLTTKNCIPTETPKNKKGLGDYVLNPCVSDIDDLGISYVTVNFRINNFLRSTPCKNNIEFKYAGKTYYFDESLIKEYDATLLSLAQKKINVSAIILLYPERKSVDKRIGHLLEHPNYDQIGEYSMPNLTNLESASLYCAAIEFLASRYSRSDCKYGHIHRWIVHNEVDAGGVWTNMGDVDMMQYMDTYIRSMRLIYYTTYKYNSNTEVLISLSHYWYDHFEEPNCHPSAHLLKLLIDYTKAEGDFFWGIAFHPYPESLVNPKSWLDKNATMKIDTNLITFKNLEILDAWIQHPKVLYQGITKRTLLLSEQNPNSMDYSEKSQQEQAASLAYVWKKCVPAGELTHILHIGGLMTGQRED